jgi:hypothetical protein
MDFVLSKGQLDFYLNGVAMHGLVALIPITRKGFVYRIRAR